MSLAISPTPRVTREAPGLAGAEVDAASSPPAVGESARESRAEARSVVRDPVLSEAELDTEVSGLLPESDAPAVSANAVPADPNVAAATTPSPTTLPVSHG